MIKNLFSIALMAFVCAFCITEISAQAKSEKNKVIIIEKQVAKDGQVTETVIVKEGKEAKKYMDNMEGTEGKKLKMLKKEAYKVEVQENGKTKIIEWDGVGEMPAEIKAIMEEEANSTNKSNQHSKIVIKKKADGLEEVMDFEYDGDELPEEVLKILEEEGIEIEEIVNDDGERILKVVKEKEQSEDSKKPQLGVNIEAHPNGVMISKVVANSAAEEGGLLKGDIITAVNKDIVSDVKSLISAISKYKPADVIIVHYQREGTTQTREVTLKEMVDPFKFKTWEQVMNSGKEKEIRIEKRIIKREK